MTKHTKHIKLSNPTLSESANPNISHQHPLWVFIKDWLGMLTLLLVLMLIAAALANSIAYWLPYSAERRLLGPVAHTMIAQMDTRQDADLQQLTEALAQEMGINDGIHIKIAIADSDTVNAFATFDGNIVIMQGLLDALDSEQAVAMVVAHELAHIHHRDPLRATSRALLTEITKAIILGSNAALDSLTYLSHLSYSRQQETAADAVGVAALLAHYGSGEGAAELYDALQQHDISIHPEWMRSHPDTAARQAHIAAIIADHNRTHPKTSGTALTPNPWQSHTP